MKLKETVVSILQIGFVLAWLFGALYIVHNYFYRPLAGDWKSPVAAGLAVYLGGFVLVSVVIALVGIVYGDSWEQFCKNLKWLFGSALIVLVCYGGAILAIYSEGFSKSRNLWAFFRPGEHPWFFGLAVVIYLFCCIIYFSISETNEGNIKPQRWHYRGKALIPFSQAKEIADRIRPAGDCGLCWGGLYLPSDAATTHFCVTGATGSGKTITIRLLMGSVLPRIGSGKDCRALLYDAKQDIICILHGMGLKCRVVTLNPFDMRGAAWNMAADITLPATAQQIAAILIPENKNASQPFFSDAARHLLTGVFISFIKTCPGIWTFRDVITAMKSRQRLFEVLQRVPETKDLLEYFQNDITAQNIMSTIQTKLQRYEFIAAAWESATEKISLTEWLNGEFILILGNDEATRSALDAINQVIFKRLSELILAQEESETRRTWLFLDEVRQAGELQGLSSLLTKGRSKGACIVLGFQDIEGLREVYGGQVANEIIGQCTNKTILRLESPETAQWASAVFGVNESILHTKSYSLGSGSGGSGSGEYYSTNQTSNETIVKAENVLASEFMAIAPTTRENGLTGYYQSPYLGAYKVRLTPDFLSTTLSEPSRTEKNFLPRPASAQYLRPWDTSDYKRLGLEEPIKTAPKTQPPLQEDVNADTGQEEEKQAINILEGVGGQ